MNVFHAFQYFGMVWWSERRSIMRGLRVDGYCWGGLAAAALLVGVAVTYGGLVEAISSSHRWWWSLTLTVVIMHFWYDGFIWSVKKGDVKLRELA